MIRRPSRQLARRKNPIDRSLALTTPTLRPNLVVSFPRSGTDFLCSAIAEDRAIRYFREYFNPCCNPERAGELARCFGDETLSNHLMLMSDPSSDILDETIGRTWARDGFNTTKENYLASKLEFFVGHFETVCLVRNAAHTFPTSRPDYIAPILWAFQSAGPYRRSFIARELNELRHFISCVALNDVGDVLLCAYFIHHFALLAACRRFGVPVVRYEDILLGTETTLGAHLAPFARFGIDIPALSQRLLATRFPSPAHSLAQRRWRFWSSVDTRLVDRMVRFLCTLMPMIADDIENYLRPIEPGGLGFSLEPHAMEGTA